MLEASHAASQAAAVEHCALLPSLSLQLLVRVVVPDSLSWHFWSCVRVPQVPAAAGWRRRSSTAMRRRAGSAEDRNALAARARGSVEDRKAVAAGWPARSRKSIIKSNALRRRMRPWRLRGSDVGAAVQLCEPLQSELASSR